MSNDKHAYGWSGHILARESENGSDKTHRLRKANCVPIPDEIFDRIVSDMGDCKLPAGVYAEPLGIISIEEAYFLACGSGFSEGYAYYGAPFEEAEVRAEKAPLNGDWDAKYLKAMKTHYGLDLPPCRLMVGCSSEH